MLARGIGDSTVEMGKRIGGTERTNCQPSTSISTVAGQDKSNIRCSRQRRKLSNPGRGGQRSQTCACPWNAWLLFQNEYDEAEFWREHVDTVMSKLDMCSLAISLLLWPVVASQLSLKTGLPWYRGNSVFLFLAVVHVVLAALACLRTRWYLENRTNAQAGFRLLLIFVAPRFATVWGPPDPVAVKFWQSVLLNSTFLCTAILPLGLQLQFKTHFFVSLLSAFTLLPWTASTYCSSWFGGDAFHSIMLNATEYIEALIIRISSLGTDQTWGTAMEGTLSKDYACWMIMAFLYSVEGFVIPSTILYCVESFCRARWLANKQPDDAHLFVRMWRESTFLAAWFAAVVVMGIWAALRLAPDAHWSLWECYEGLIGN